MVTSIATSPAAGATAFTNEHKIDRCQNGNLWAGYVNTTNATIFFSYSTDNGATWTQIADTLPVHVSHGSFFIDLDDFCHLVVKNSVDGFLYYMRGTPNAGRTSWTWSAAQVVYNGGTFGAVPDIVSFRDPAGGGGWVTHIVWSYVNGATTIPQYDKFTITSGGVFAHPVANANLATSSYGTSIDQFPSITFQHIGDGKTAVANPALFAAWSAGTTGTGFGIRYKKATYATGTWTWGAEVAINDTIYIPNANDNMFVSCLFNGDAVYIVILAFLSANYYLQIHKRDVADTTTTLIYNSNALSGINGAFSGSAAFAGLSSIFIVGESFDGTRLNRYKYNLIDSTVTITSLGAYTSVYTHVSMKRGNSNNRVEWIYTDGSVSPFTIKYDSLVFSNVSLSRIYKWNVKASVSLNRIFKWNVRAVLSTTRIFKWNVRSALSTTRVYKWNVRLPVAPFTRTFKWNVIGGVLINRTFKWNVIQTISTSRVFKWNTFQQALIARIYLWKVLKGWEKINVTPGIWTEQVNDPDVWTEIPEQPVSWH